MIGLKFFSIISCIKNWKYSLHLPFITYQKIIQIPSTIEISDLEIHLNIHFFL